MKKIFTFLFVCISAICLFACSKEANNSFESVIENSNVEYEYKSGDIITEVIPLYYDDAGDFSDGLAPVKLNGKYGYIDKNRNEVIPYKYDIAYSFNYGLACVKLNNKYGYVDKNGNEVIPLKYDIANNFNYGLACVKLNNKYGYIDKNGNEVIPFKYDIAKNFSYDGLAIVGINNKWGYIDKNGKEIISIKYDESFYFSDGLARVELNGKYGYIDKKGKEVIPVECEHIYKWSNGLLHIEKNDKCELFNINDKKIISKKYDNIYDFSDGLAKVELNGKCGYINEEGKEVIPLKFHSSYYGGFHDGIALEMNSECNLVYIDKNGNELFSGKFFDCGKFSEGLAHVREHNKRGCGYIDKNGKEVIPFKYDKGWEFHDGFAEVTIGDKCGFIDKNGNEVTPLKYDAVTDFSDGLARVQSNDKCGFVDKNGNEVISLKYDDAQSFSNGFAKVKLNNKWGYIDKNGKEIIPIKYEENEVLIYKFSDERAIVYINDKGGYIDESGKEIIPIRYDHAWDFHDGVALVELNDKYGYIDKDGNEITPLIYAHGFDFNKGLASAQMNEKSAYKSSDYESVYIDKNGNEIIYHNTTENFFEGLGTKYLNGKWGYIDKNENEVVPFKYDLASLFHEGLAAVCINSKWGYISYLNDDNRTDINALKNASFGTISGLPSREAELRSDNHFYLDDNIQKSTWVYHLTYYYHVDGDGNIEKNKWIEQRYVGEDGKMYRGRQTSDGKYVGSDGLVVNVDKDLTESLLVEAAEPDSWYKTQSGLWYYFENDRKTTKKGWFTDKRDNQTYYLDPSTGVMAVGWTKINGNEYYFNESHDNVNNWYETGDGFYESYGKKVKAYGSMFKDEVTPDGYYVDKDGVKGEVINTQEYIFPDSDKRLLTNEEVMFLDATLLRYAINEIYARHGRIFKDAELNNYFTSKSWYRGLYDNDHFDESCLSDIEFKNIDLLVNAKQLK